ncbi:unnamed protein product [Brachionus calyciflorus]|uniref:MULE transposase domain-containing protein n=1 Tax=Brachionus calyciflorus TaxID=104777 RepID=A0A814PB82_9BILA|nr:unnamed protein product [Brachionus calyciflorus]
MITNLINSAKDLGFKLCPSTIVSDFEQAAINAYELCFKNVIVKGCHFHFTQCLSKNIQKVGYCEEYSSKNKVNEWINMFKSLTFLLQDLIPSAFDLINNLLPKYNSKFNEFLNYFKDTWYGNSKVKYSFNLWNHYYTEGTRTNNHVEGYNHKINNYINYAHPHIYSSINTLKY